MQIQGFADDEPLIVAQKHKLLPSNGLLSWQHSRDQCVESVLPYVNVELCVDCVCVSYEVFVYVSRGCVEEFSLPVWF